MTTATTALTTTTQQPARGLALSLFDDLWRFAQIVAKTDFPPKDFRGKPEACFSAIEHGAEVGLSPMQSLQSIAVINGRASIWGDAALALVLASLACEWVRESVEGDGDAMVAICEAKRRQFERPTVVRFSVADAKKANLWGKSGPWQQYPKRMLQLRARGFALRDAFPDVLRGLVTAEEAQDYAGDIPATVARPAALPAPAEPAPKPAAQPRQATDDDLARARNAINAATTPEQIERFRAEIWKRADAGAYTSVQASDLIDLCDLRVEILGEPEDNGGDLEHEAAEHEVAS